VLTNGIQWQFFADPTVACLMHTEPFLVFDAGDLGKRENLDLLEKLTKPKFDPSIVRGAQAIEGMKAQLAEWLSAPPDDFVRLMSRRFVGGKIGKIILEEYRGYLNAAIRRYLDDYVEKRLPTTSRTKVTSEIQTADTPADSAATTSVAVASQTAPSETVSLAPDFVDGQTLEEPTEEVNPVAEPAQVGDKGQFQPEKRVIKGADLVNDIRSGMSFDVMSEKYGISAAKLSQFLHHLVLKGMLRNEELPEQTL